MRITNNVLCAIAVALIAALACATGAADDKKGAAGRVPNRLARETSPYLLLHAENPVDWYPWGPEAFAKAKAENKPIFLSVGYSSCYWCHVMERESFVDAEIAQALNAGFVCIKVDREERPDVDQVYMTALQAFRPGGWPMSLFLTPDGRPFFGGTYSPPRDRDDAPGFLTIVNAVAKAWSKNRPELEKTANEVTEIVRGRLKAASGKRKELPPREVNSAALAQFGEQFDSEFGGIGFSPAKPNRPKFPQPVDLAFLLDQARGNVEPNASVDPRKMVITTLDHMARGGIRDHLGGGYHRYSTDRFWLVPHFEKMLYDNAQLASLHLTAFEATGDARWRDEAVATFGFIERTMTGPEGGFYSSLDAETKGDEGAYYVWTRAEVAEALGDHPDAGLFAEIYGLTGEPNFEKSKFVLHEPKSRAEQAQARAITPEALENRLRPLRERLLTAREKRLAPRCDDKILTAWNGLMIAAYADGYRVLKNDAHRRAAEKCAHFVLERMRSPDGRLLRSFRSGQAKLPGYLDDYAYFAHGLLRLYAATDDRRWLREAQSIAEKMLADFEDREEGGFFYTSSGHETLLARAKDPFDDALPSANGIAILDLIALWRATGDRSYRDHAGKAIGTFSASLSQVPAAMPSIVAALAQYRFEPDALGTRMPAGAGTEDENPTMVTAQARLADLTAKVSAGMEFDAIITIKVRPGWHIYANPAGHPEMTPTVLKLDPKTAGGASIVKVTYPAGQSKALGSSGGERVSLYEGSVDFRARLAVAEQAKPGAITIRLSLSFQACNDRVCAAPASIEIPLGFKIGEAGQSR